jgi:hypothetical protein
MAPKKHFLIILSFLVLIKLCVSSPVTNPNKTETIVPEMPENLCPLPPQLGYSGY